MAIDFRSMYWTTDLWRVCRSMFNIYIWFGSFLPACVIFRSMSFLEIFPVICMHIIDYRLLTCIPDKHFLQMWRSDISFLTIDFRSMYWTTDLWRVCRSMFNIYIRFILCYVDSTGGTAAKRDPEGLFDKVGLLIFAPQKRVRSMFL